MLHSQKIVYYSGRITWRPGWERAREHTHHSIYVCTIREISFAESITRTLTFVHRPTTAAVTVAAANINISAKNHAFFPSKRRDVSNLVADGYKTYTNMRIDRHMHTGCLNWTLKLTLGPHLLSLSCVCVCLQMWQSHHHYYVILVLSIWKTRSLPLPSILIVWRTGKRVERITKSYHIFHVAMWMGSCHLAHSTHNANVFI